MSGLNNRGSLTSDPIRNFRFLVTFNPVSSESDWQTGPTFGFTSVSGLSIATESIPYREGQFNTTVTQVPGQSTFSPITLQRGVTIGSKRNWEWMSYLFKANAADNSAIGWGKSFRANVIIDVLAHPVPYAANAQSYNLDDPTGTVGSTSPGAAGDDTVLMRFRVFNAWPTSVAYSDLSAGDNALMVEQMTLVHEGFNLMWASYDDAGQVVGIGENN